jgi:pilus assembly protein Flp/PilA
MTFLKNFIRDEEGQDLVEYALLLGFVALASTAILTSVGQDINALFGTADSKVKAASAAIK